MMDAQSRHQMYSKVYLLGLSTSETSASEEDCGSTHLLQGDTKAYLHSLRDPKLLSRPSSVSVGPELPEMERHGSLINLIFDGRRMT